MSITIEQSLRQEVLRKYGNRCRACGFNYVPALQIDHVLGGGTQELRDIGRLFFYKTVLADMTNAYQLLCANCNVIKKNLYQEYRLSPNCKTNLQNGLPADHLWLSQLPVAFKTKDLKKLANKHQEILSRTLHKWVTLGLVRKTGHGCWLKLCEKDLNLEVNTNK